MPRRRADADIFRHYCRFDTMPLRYAAELLPPQRYDTLPRCREYNIRLPRYKDDGQPACRHYAAPAAAAGAATAAAARRCCFEDAADTDTPCAAADAAAAP